MWYTCMCVLTLAVAVSAQAPTIRNDEGIANAGYTNSKTINFRASGTKAGFPKISCRLDSQGASTCQDPQTYTGLTDGKHTLVVQFALSNGQVDTSAQTVFTWTVDTTPPPKPQIAVKPKLQTNTKMPQFQFTVAGTQIGGLSYSCQLALPGTLPISFPCFQTTDVSSAASPVQGVPSTGLLEGPYTMQVKAIDAAGNQGASQRYGFTVDLEAPNVVLDSTTPNTLNGETTNSPSMTFAFHSIDKFPERTDAIGHYTTIIRNPCPLYNCTMQCSLDNAPLTPCVSPITYTSLTAVGRVERHTFRVVATDNATNVGVGPDELQYSWSIDGKKPIVWTPTLGSSFLSLPPRYTNKTAASFTFTTDEPGQVDFTCRLDGSGLFTACPTKPYTGLAEGEHTLQIQVTDRAGNIQTLMNVRRPVNYTNAFGVNSTTSVFQWRVDTTPPPKPQIAVKPKLQTNTRMPQFQFTVEGTQIGGLSYSCQLALPGTRPISFACFQTTDVSSAASPVQGVPSTGLFEGPYTMQVKAIDAAGNQGASQRHDFTVDLEAPNVVLDSTTPNTLNGETTNSPSMTFAFHSIDKFPERTDAFGHYTTIIRNPCPLYNCTMQCSLDNAPLTPCVSPITYTSLTAVGRVERHTFRVVATDNATNVGVGPDELQYSWSIDRIPPNTTFTQTPSKAIAIDSATFEWTTTEPAARPPQFFCSLDNGAQFNCTPVPTAGRYRWTLQNLTNSFNHIFAVVAVDFYGNAAPAITYAWQVDGGWSSWTSYGQCFSVSGGGCSKQRSRTCTNGGALCTGHSQQLQNCSCPVNGGWSPWTAIGACSVSCGGGQQLIVRSCTNPTPAHGGTGCTGLHNQTISCQTKPCPVDGQWSNWSPYSQCNASCEGTQVRNRSCNSPTPDYGGKICIGNYTHQQPCGKMNCPVDGGWSQWSGNLDACSVSCGAGSRTLKRYCNTPVPHHGGLNCSGVGAKTKPCFLGECPEAPSTVELTSTASEVHANSGSESHASTSGSKTVAIGAGAAAGGLFVLTLGVLLLCKSRIVNLRDIKDGERELRNVSGSTHLVSDSDQNIPQRLEANVAYEGCELTRNDAYSCVDSRLNEVLSNSEAGGVEESESTTEGQYTYSRNL
ncbi:uncharacterized protein LOC135821428 [Sycon ciliatum]|uniref:uncharacterized protein LOC135821428 n=1 Tax=Sycon ciliatum TaxID=27933 RepID=UPI0031F5F62D